MKSNNKISLSLKSQIKMALHATKYGYSTPIHGIVLGKSSNSDDDGSLDVLDVVPVCHEVPTKPIVDMALRLTDAYLQQQQQEQGLKIIGWYTANSNNNNNSESELPNASACRIASSIAEIDEDGGDNIVLLLVSTLKLVSSMTKQSGTDNLPIICNIYEKSSHRTFTQQVNEDRIISLDSLKGGGGKISTAMEQCLSSLGDADAAGGGGKSSDIALYDYVDHLNDGGRGDWIVNDTVNKFFSG